LYQRNMKSILFLAAITFSGVFGAPATSISDPTPIPTSATFKVYDLDNSVNGSVLNAAATATQYWVCTVISNSTFRHGWAQGDSESSALSLATSYCGQSDCSYYSCAEAGCVGLDFGLDGTAVTSATGHGADDGPQAASDALSTCQQQTTGCGEPVYYCAQYIV